MSATLLPAQTLRRAYAYLAATAYADDATLLMRLMIWHRAMFTYAITYVYLFTFVCFL